MNFRVAALVRSGTEKLLPNRFVCWAIFDYTPTLYNSTCATEFWMEEIDAHCANRARLHQGRVDQADSLARGW